MNIKMKGKIAKNGKYLTSTDDVRLDVGGNGKWCIAGFAHKLGFLSTVVGVFTDG